MAGHGAGLLRHLGYCRTHRLRGGACVPRHVVPGYAAASSVATVCCKACNTSSRRRQRESERCSADGGVGRVTRGAGLSNCVAGTQASMGEGYYLLL